MSQFTFDLDAAKAAVLYVVRHVNNPTKHKVFKLLYFADKKHLERYGRFIAGDDYSAMEYGPVPSHIYSAIRQITTHAGSSFVPPEVEAAFAEGLKVEGYKFSALQEPDIDALSDSDIECLDESIREHGHKSFGQLTDESHDAAWQKTNPNGIMDICDIANTLGNSNLVLEHLRDPYPGS